MLSSGLDCSLTTGLSGLLLRLHPWRAGWTQHTFWNVPIISGLPLSVGTQLTSPPLKLPGLSLMRANVKNSFTMILSKNSKNRWLFWKRAVLYWDLTSVAVHLLHSALLHDHWVRMLCTKSMPIAVNPQL